MSGLIQRSRNKRTLYAIAFEIHENGDIQPGMEYVHAVNRRDARRQFIRGRHNRKINIVAIGPVIGYYVKDNHGDVLSTD